jgi:hypothetical protein
MQSEDLSALIKLSSLSSFFYVQIDSNTESRSETESLNHYRDVLVSIDSSMEYTRRPPPAVCWM